MRVFTPAIAPGGVRILDLAGDRLTVTACNLPFFEIETEPGGDILRLRKGHTFRPERPFTRLVLRNLRPDSALQVELQAGFGELQDRGGDASVGGFRSSSFYVATAYQVAASSPADEQAVAVLANPAGSGRLFLVRRVRVEVGLYASPFVFIGTWDDSFGAFTPGATPKSLYLGEPDSVGEVYSASVAAGPSTFPPVDFTRYLDASAGNQESPWEVTFDSPVVIPPGANFGAATDDNDGVELTLNVFFEEV